MSDPNPLGPPLPAGDPHPKGGETGSGVTTGSPPPAPDPPALPTVECWAISYPQAVNCSWLLAPEPLLDTDFVATYR